MSSETNTSASTSTSATATGNEMILLVDEIKKYDTVKLIEFLQGQENLELNFAKECKDKKLRSFSSYKTKKELSEVLRKYGINSNEITKILPFESEPVEIDDEDEELEQCITEIKCRMGIIGSATGRNEAVHCKYIFLILYASIYIVKRITKKGITIDLQFEVVGKEASDQVNYVIKKVIDVVNEELIAITEGKQKDLVTGFMQNIMQLESSHHTNMKKKKASVAFNDEFDYLYGIVTMGRAFQSFV